MLCGIIAHAQSFTLAGTVVDTEGKPVEFATVACASQAKVTMTDLKDASAYSCTRPTA